MQATTIQQHIENLKELFPEMAEGETPMEWLSKLDDDKTAITCTGLGEMPNALDETLQDLAGKVCTTILTNVDQVLKEAGVLDVAEMISMRLQLAENLSHVAGQGVKSMLASMYAKCVSGMLIYSSIIDDADDDVNKMVQKKDSMQTTIRLSRATKQIEAVKANIPQSMVTATVVLLIGWLT